MTQHMLVPNSWDLALFEKSTGVSGMWHESNYPGVAKGSLKVVRSTGQKHVVSAG